MKSYTSYKNSKVEWIGEFPNHWEINKLKYYSDFKNGYSFSSKDWEESGLPVIRMSNIGDDGKLKVSSKNLRFVSKETYQSSKDFTIKKGDILISMTDMNPEMIWLGSTILFNEEQIYLLNQRVGLIRIQSQEIDNKYYWYLSNTDSIRNQLKETVYPNVQTNLSSYPIQNCLIILPPLLEQKKIVSFLDEKTNKIDRLIQSKQRKIELLKEKRTSLINEVVTKGLNPDVEMKDSGVEWYEKIPKHWMRGKLSYHTSRIGDGLHSTPKYVDESEYKFINGNNLINGRIKYFDSTKSVSKDEYEKHYIELTTKTILLSINGTIGNLSFYNDEKVILGKSSCYINCQDTINRSYLYYLLGSDSIMKYFTFELTGTTIYNLSLESVRNTPIPIPPLDEQKEIIQYLNSETNTIDKTVQLETDKIDLLKEYKQSLISEVVTGKVNVQEDVDEVLV